jgi:hypothetical protein
MDYQSSAKLRARAERCRAIASTYADAATRDLMFGIAAEYDRMADRIARDERIKRTFERMAALFASIEKHNARALASSNEIRQMALVSREVIASSRELMARTDRSGGPPGPALEGTQPSE